LHKPSFHHESLSTPKTGKRRPNWPSPRSRGWEFVQLLKPNIESSRFFGLAPMLHSGESDFQGPKARSILPTNERSSPMFSSTRPGTGSKFTSNSPTSLIPASGDSLICRSNSLRSTSVVAHHQMLAFDFLRGNDLSPPDKCVVEYSNSDRS